MTHRRYGRAKLVAVVLIAVAVAALLSTELRLLVAGLPIGRGLFTVPLAHSLLRGVIVVAVGTAALAIFCLAAYATATPRWSFHGADWADIVHERGVRTAYGKLQGDEQRRAQRKARAELARGRGRGTGPPPREAAADPRIVPTAPGARLLRVVAGFNLIVLGAVLGLAVAQFVAKFESAWWAILPAGVIVFAAVVAAATWLGPLFAPPWAHALAGAVIGVIGLLCSPPVGLLVLAGVVIATGGRRLAREAATIEGHRVGASPVAWVAAALYMAVVIGYEAAPPVSFPGVVATAASAQYIGGELSRTGQRVALLQCTARVNGTSTATRLRTISAIVTPTVSAAFDSGSRPSLAGLALSLVGIDGPRAYFVPSLRPRAGPCAGAPPAALAPGYVDPALGAAVIAGPAPPGGRAHDGEAPIAATTDPRIARLALRYQPTLLVTFTDRFWPVSVSAVVDDIGPGATRTCRFATQSSNDCLPPQPLRRSDDSTSYLRFPSTRDFTRRAVTEDPTSQFAAFERGQGTDFGSTAHWFSDPGVLDPWRTAEIYFYYEGAVHFHGIPGQLPGWPNSSGIDTQPVAALARTDGLIGLEYWFFYPYNYYPLVVDKGLMNLAPLAAHVVNVDRHQGDWEHVTVLLDQRTLRPAYLYMARHADEGQFYAWSGGGLAFDDGHPLVQAAFGGHPSYPAGCGEQVRTKHGAGQLSDWLSCGTGRFAFRAASTPLVDLSSRGTPWACWPGHFGEARLGFEISTQDADWVTTVLTDNVFVAGPRSPLWQAENGSVNHFGVCDRGAAAAQRDALHSPLAARLAAITTQGAK